MEKKLQVDIGSWTSAGIKTLNEDSVGWRLPESEDSRRFFGAIAAVADGVSSAEAGREASTVAIRELLEIYYQSPETWAVERALRTAGTAINHHLYKLSHAFANQEKGYICTLVTAVVKSHRAHIFHIGDSRAYRLGQTEKNAAAIQLLTRDHAAQVGKHRRMLARALGMDNEVSGDYSSLSLNEGDYLILTSDGVHDFLSESQIQALVWGSTDSDAACERVGKAALEAGSDDNISVVIIRVDQLPESSLEDYSQQLTRLPFPPDLKPGQSLDGLRVVEELFASSRSQVYRVMDEANGASLIMKTPSRNFEEDIAYIDRFVQEEWVGQRIHSPHVVRIAHQTSPRTFLYYLMEPVDGQTLDEWMAANPEATPRQKFDLIRQIATGLKAMHQQDMVHQDLKPANIIVGENHHVTLVDFGSVYAAALSEIYSPLTHEGALGTATYSDPNYLWGHNSGVQGDIYSLATITYELFTQGELPFGDAIESCRSRLDFDRLRYQPAHECDAAIPQWFDGALKKALSLDLEVRYQRLDDFIRDLRHPNPDFLKVSAGEAQDRGTVVLWQMLSGLWMLLLVLVVLLFSCQETPLP